MKLLQSDQLGQIESHIAHVLEHQLDAPGLRPFKQMIHAYVMAGGKRVRPQLAAWTYQMSAGADALSAPVLDVAAGWELFHAFLLVHDDIIDDAHVRREQAALHVQLASLDSNSLTFGTNLGIVAGDLLFSVAMSLWHELDVEPSMHRDLLRILSRTACTTGFGQAIDICVSHLPMDQVDQATLLREYGWKTAAYTFEGPMLSGAILAGLGAPARAAISRFALSLGQAYQLQNDLLDLAQPAHDGCDLVQGKRTVTLLQYRQSLESAMRPDFDERLSEIASGDGRSLAWAEDLRREMLESEATVQSRRVIDELLEAARTAAGDDALPPTLAAGLATLLDALTSQYFAATQA